MSRKKREEHVMQMLAVAFLLLSANAATADGDLDRVDGSGTPPTRNTPLINAHNRFIILTQKEVDTVTLTVPPSTVTTTITLTAKEINLPTITQTERITRTEPTTVTKTLHEHSRSLEACLGDMGSILTECIAVKTARQGDLTRKMIIPTTVWISTTVTEAPVTVTSSVTEAILDTSTPLVDQTIVTVTAAKVPSNGIIGDADELVDALSSLVGNIPEVYPFVDDMSKKVLDSLTHLADANTVQTQLKKLPTNQSGVFINQMMKITDSINVIMVDESDKFKRVVPINFMGSVKRLIRYLQRLIRF